MRVEFNRKFAEIVTNTMSVLGVGMILCFLRNFVSVLHLKALNLC